MTIKEDFVLRGKHGAFLLDYCLPKSWNKKLLVFCHGFKGFKDWGAWHLMANEFVEKGFGFVKFNFSQNGIGLEDKTAFTRLDLYFENNYSKELDDLTTVIDWIDEETTFNKKEELILMGHSRGGGIVLTCAANDQRVNKVVTLASIANFNRFGDEQTLAQWRQLGYRNFYNSRTKQDMKIGIQFYEDYLKNKSILHIEKSVKKLQQPLLIIHGKQDTSVGYSHAQRIHQWSKNSRLHFIESANHVFGMHHPYLVEELPKEMKEVVEEVEVFLGIRN